MKISYSLLILSALLVMSGARAFTQGIEDNRSGSEDVIVNISSIDVTGGILAPMVSDIEKTVGEEVCFTLTAKDKNGNVIRSWNTSGNATTLTLIYSANPASTANTDSSTQSWSADPLEYSWAEIRHNGTELNKISADEWTIPASSFDDNGTSEICIVHTRADTGVYIEITPTVVNLNQKSATMAFKVDEITNFLVEITSATAQADQVYHLRPYELVVSPRDKYLNVSSEVIRSRFSARFPGEFDSNKPGLADIFSGDVFLSGVTNYLIASRIVRELPNDQLQSITAFASANPNIKGVSNLYEVLTHAPVPFNLLSPADHYIVNYETYNKPETFTWEKPNPPDPYTNIIISRFGTPTPVSDVVTYTWVLMDSISLTRAEKVTSNDNGSKPELTLTHAQFLSVTDKISGLNNTKSYHMVWYVEATDGLYTTLSSPPNNDPVNPGHYISLNNTVAASSPAVPGKLQLEQNYPNPFNPSTTIRFSVPKSSRVTLKIFDLLGAEVATLIDKELSPGDYTKQFSANSLPSGIYLYKLKSEGQIITRRMTLMK